MRLQRIQELVFFRPWLITPSAHASIRALLDRKLHDAAKGGLLDLFVNPRPEPSLDEAGVGHVHMIGPIGVGLSQIEKQCGSTDTADLISEARAMVDDGAEKLMVHGDSPGGMAGGTPEAAEAMSELEVPWFVYAGPAAMLCSAAYYFSAAADKIYASESAEIGSIGVYMPWVDQTAAYAAEGLNVELIKNKEGDLKGAGYPGTALTDAQREDLQKGCQQLFDMFAEFVQDKRPGGISADSMRGQSFLAAEARNRHLIDGVASYESAYKTLLGYERR
jgi:ClpP class serine protease